MPTLEMNKQNLMLETMSKGNGELNVIDNIHFIHCIYMYCTYIIYSYMYFQTSKYNLCFHGGCG